MNARSALCAAALFLFALGLRVAYVRAVEVVDPFRSDAKQYAIYASNLVDRGLYSKDASADARPDSFRPPGYPALVSIVLRIAGDGRAPEENAFYPLLLHLQAVLGALMAPLTVALGRRFLPPWAAWLAGCGVALSPHLVALTGYVLTETLYGLLLLLAILLTLRALERDTRLRWALGGGAFGAAALTNSTALPLAFLFALVTAWARRDALRAAAPGLAVFLVVFAVAPAAWSFRNALNVPSGARTSGDRAFATLTHGIYPGWVHRSPRFRYYAYLEDERIEEIRSSLGGLGRVLAERAMRRPLRYASWYLLEKPYTGWSWRILQGQGDVYVYPVKTTLYQQSRLADATRVFMKILHAPLLLLAFVGAAATLARARRARGRALLDGTPLLLVSIGVYYTALFVVFAPWPRYSIPLRPELYVVALWSAVAVVMPALRRALRRGA